MTGSISINMVNRLAQTVYHLDREDVIVIFRGPVFFRRFFCPGADLPHTLTTPNFHFRLIAKFLQHAWQKNLCNILVHQQRFHGVADGYAAHLRIIGHTDRFVQITAFLVNINMADPCSGFNNGHRCILHHGLDQPCASARNQHIQIAFKMHQFRRSFSGRIPNQLYCTFRQPRCGRSLLQSVHDGAVGLDRLRSAAQNAGVAAFDANGRRIACDVRPGFKDNTDNAQRHALLQNAQSVGARPHLIRRADRIWQQGNIAKSLRHALYPLVVQCQSFNKGGLQTLFLCSLNVAFIGRKDLRLVCNQRIGHCQKRIVSFFDAAYGHLQSRGTRFFAQFQYRLRHLYRLHSR